MSDCCAGRRGNAGSNWHLRRNEPLCENARAERDKKNAQRVRWTPGSSILVEEIESL